MNFTRTITHSVLFTLLLALSGFFASAATVQQLDEPVTIQSFPVPYPQGLAFDGANIWIANEFSDTVSELRASDGALLGTFPVGNRPFGVGSHDGSIWVTNTLDYTVTKLLAPDGSLQDTFFVGASPRAIAFDDTHIWVTNSRFPGRVARLRTSDDAGRRAYVIDPYPVEVLFDGANIWLTCQSTVIKISRNQR